MLRYKVLYLDLLIGILEVDGENYRFESEKNLDEKTKGALALFPELLDDYDGVPIPVLANRINDARRFGVVDNIQNQTDGFSLIAMT